MPLRARGCGERNAKLLPGMRPPVASAEDDPEPGSSPIGVETERLVHITTIPVTLGFLRGQAAFLRRKSIGVHAISSPAPELARFAQEEQVQVHAVEMARQITPLRDLLALWRVWGVLRGVRPVIVDAHTPKAGLLGMIAATLARTPVRVYHLHGLRFVTASGWKRRLLLLADRTACALADRVLAVSPSIRAIAIEEGVCPPEKIKVLLRGSVNGVDATGRFKPQMELVRSAARSKHGIPQDALVVGFVGRLARDKGIVELAGAWRQLRANPRLHLLLVGALDSTDAPPTEIMTALHSDPRVHRAGQVPVADTPPLYAAMDVVVLPTYREGFGQVALEAAAMALPIVATMVSGCVDAVRDAVTGTLVPARDIEGLVGALRRYLEDPALRAEHGSAARRRALAEFSPDAMWNALAEEYGDLILRARARGPERAPTGGAR
ncbi:glycosyltransferase family 4 protein [Anaeromyxobacter terrae]|uniref:glycosyltransferase family 4 protein n=1 Tax=Anaeromyxobacter terrae TaxID=2925406 RepID=UPI001F595412|nr:glycosyltransferase family 4 protein [Anaeromyxobacter sp. SG22]